MRVRKRMMTLVTRLEVQKTIWKDMMIGEMRSLVWKELVEGDEEYPPWSRGNPRYIYRRIEFHTSLFFTS